MLAEVRLADTLPFTAVATPCRRWSVWMQGLVLLTVFTLSQVGTAGVTAGFLCLLRHSTHLYLDNKKANAVG